MARFALTSAFLIACALLALSPVKAFSPGQFDRAVGVSSGIVQVSKKCDRLFDRCVKKCKKDSSCVSFCAFDREWCNGFCPNGPGLC